MNQRSRKLRRKHSTILPPHPRNYK